MSTCRAENIDLPAVTTVVTQMSSIKRLDQHVWKRGESRRAGAVEVLRPLLQALPAN